MVLGGDLLAGKRRETEITEVTEVTEGAEITEVTEGAGKLI